MFHYTHGLHGLHAFLEGKATNSYIIANSLVVDKKMTIFVFTPIKRLNQWWLSLQITNFIVTGFVVQRFCKKLF